MTRYLTAFVLLLSLFTAPAFADEEAAAPEGDAPAAEAEEAPEAPEAEGDAPEAPEDAAAPEDAPEGEEGDEAAEEAPEAEEGDAGDKEVEAESGTEVPVTDAEAMEMAISLVEAVKHGQWPLAVGLFLSLLVFFVNRFHLKDKLGPKAIPWLAFAVGLLGATGMGLVSGMPVLDAVVAGIIAGVTAIGGWEMLFKHFGSPAEPTGEPVAEPAEKPSE